MRTHVYLVQAIAQYFDAVGRVVAVRIDKTPDKSGTPRVWVEFETQAAAHDACELSGQVRIVFREPVTCALAALVALALLRYIGRGLAKSQLHGYQQMALTRALTSAQEVYGTAIRVQPSKSAIHSNGLLRGDRPPGTEAATAVVPATQHMASPGIPSPAAVAQHLVQAQHAMRPRPTGSTSSGERADMDEAPPGTTTPAEVESESRRMGAAALMQHEWQPAGDAAHPEAVPASEPAPYPDPAENGAAGDAAALNGEAAAAMDADAAALPDAADHDGEGEAGHAGTNGFADGHASGVLSVLLRSLLHAAGSVMVSPCALAQTKRMAKPRQSGPPMQPY